MLNSKKLHTSKETRTSVVLFLLLSFSYIYFFPRWADPNQNSRLDMIVAIVHDGTFQIDRYVSNTVDYAKVGEHYYSDKAPGAAFLGVPVYWMLRTALALPWLEQSVARLQTNSAFQATLNPEGSGIFLEKVQFALGQIAVTLAVSAIPSALLGVMIYRYLCLFTRNPWPRLLVALSFGLLTPAYTYAGAFYGHQISAALLFAGFFLVAYDKSKLTPGRLLLVGLVLGYSVVSEYPAALIAWIIFLYTCYQLIKQDQLKRVLWIALSGAAVMAGWMAYNNTVFGGPLQLGYGYSELWVQEHSTGFMSLTLPHQAAIWGITFSPFRGLFFYSPVMIFAIPGFYLWWVRGKYRAEWLVSLTSVIAMFLFNSSSIMWWGGFAVGPRYILLMLPFLALALLFPFLEWGGQLWFRFAYVISAIWSLVATWGLTLAGQAYPPDYLRNPLVEYALPAWTSGDIARNIGTVLGVPGIGSVLLYLAGVVLIAAFGYAWNKGIAQDPESQLNPIHSE